MNLILLELLLILSLACSAFAVPKVGNKVNETLKKGNKVDIFITFQDSAKQLKDLRGRVKKVNQTKASKGKRNKELVVALKNHTGVIQASAMKVLKTCKKSSNITIVPLWISNRIGVKGVDESCIKQLTKLGEIDKIDTVPIIKRTHPGRTSKASSSSASNSSIRRPTSLSTSGDPDYYDYYYDDPEPEEAVTGVRAIEAPAVWAKGNRGEGVVIGTIDTGARSTHEALTDNFRAERGWFDPVNGEAEPYDDNGHGTHVLGTACGKTNGIGVAPGAQWMACKGFGGDGSASAMDLCRCGQYMFCPWDINGDEDDTDCSMAPDIVSNSWGTGSGNDFFDEVINAWDEVGIISVFAAGNDGDTDTCECVNYPGESANVIAVGAMEDDKSVAWFSGKGPTPAGDVKPDIAAPGVDVLSAWGSDDSAYEQDTGTSMATPHVAGVIALLLWEDSSLSLEDIKDLLAEGADKTIASGETCGDIPDDDYPNNHVGYGRVNARRSFELIE